MKEIAVIINDKENLLYFFFEVIKNNQKSFLCFQIQFQLIKVILKITSLIKFLLEN